MPNLRAIQPRLILPLLIVWTFGCSFGVKRGGSDSAAGRPTTIALAPDEATTAASLFNSPDSTGAGPLATLDVAGVKLGMTAEQAIAALKSFDANLVFSKRYLTERDVTAIMGQAIESSTVRGKTGEPDECAKTSDFHAFTGILAAESTAFIWGKTSGRGYVGCWLDATQQPADEPVSVYVQLTPDPGNHHVIGVSMRKKFGAPAPMQTVLDSVLQKYPSDSTASYSHNAENNNLVSYQCRFWRFDANGRTLAETAARTNGLLGLDRYDGELPSHAIEGASVGIDLQILAAANRGLVQEYGIAMYDENALYQFNAQVKTIYDKSHQK
jgi:hypothetical protein